MATEETKPADDTILRNTKSDARAEAARRLDAANASGEPKVSFADLPELDRIPPIRSMPSLSNLDLSRTKISDISPLTVLTDLRHLNLFGTPISDISPLANLIKLDHLTLWDTRVTDLSHLTNLRNLSYLDLDGVRASDLSAIIQLTELRLLFLDGAPITDLSPLRALKELRVLDLNRTMISDLSPIEGLARLYDLRIASTKVTDIAALSKMTSLQDLNLSDINISDLSPIGGLPALRSINLSGTKILDLSPIERFTNLHSIVLRDVAVSDLSSLSSLVKLSYIDISRTQVSDLSPLANSRALQTLIVNGSRVRDLSPIANVTPLVGGAKSHPEVGGLSFLNCPLDDRALIMFSTLSDPDRTIKTLSYLRRQQGLVPVDLETPSESPDDDTSNVAQLAAHLAQNPLGARFEPVHDYLAISASGTDSDQEVTTHSSVRQLHEIIKSRGGELSDRAIRLSNLPGWQMFPPSAEKFRKLISVDIESVADQIALVWAELVSLGSFAEQDEAVRSSLDAFVEPLAPDVRRCLLDLIQVAGPWVRQFPTARKLDDEHASFQAPHDEIPSARGMVLAARAEDVIRSGDAEILDGALAAGERLGHQSKKAGNFGVLSTRNLVLGAAAIAATGVAEGFFKHVGEEVGKQSILAEKTARLILDSEEPLLKFLESLPADVRTAVRALIAELKRRGGDHEFPFPDPPKEKPIRDRRRSGSR
jgi:hypothetical protein